jgi:sugar phosphate isomerase/epimerase
MTRLSESIQVNIPFALLQTSYLSYFLERRLNPEIGLDAQALENFSLAHFGRIAQALRQGGLTVTLHGPFMDLAPGSLDPDVRGLTTRRFEQVLELVPLFRPKTVVFHAGYDQRRYRFVKEAWLENSLRTWSSLAERIVGEGSLLVLENVYEEGPQEMGVLFQKLEDYGVGFCLDTGHQAAFGRVPLETWVSSLYPYLKQVHLHDNQGDKDEHLALGKGNIDFQGLLDSLRAKMQEPPPITLEPHKGEDFLPSLEYLERIWPW